MAIKVPFSIFYCVYSSSYSLWNISNLPLVSNVFNMVIYAGNVTLFCYMDSIVTEDVTNRKLLKMYDGLGDNKLLK